MGTGVGFLFAQAPAADRTLRVPWGRRHLALTPHTKLRFNGAAQDAVLNRRDQSGSTRAATLFPFRPETWTLTLINATAETANVVAPEGLLHEGLHVEELQLGHCASLASVRTPLTTADALGSALRWRKCTVLADATAIFLGRETSIGTHYVRGGAHVMQA